MPATDPTWSIPDYELLRQVGVGGYGEVWLARSTATGTLRAVKFVRRATFADAKPFEREFAGLLKFEAVSRAHPSQLALFHVGRDEAAGWFYYVMELADPAEPVASVQCSVISNQSQPPAVPAALCSALSTGHYSPRTLRSDLESGRLPAARVLELGLALTEALAHLHGHGLVHRDVKPSNLIFVNGRPKLADIGLVTDASDVRSFVGTEGYLPPDGPGTPAADIFALGKVLYEALTGLDRRQFPELPADLRQWSDAALAFELNAVLLKACAVDARHRYASTEVMQADLRLLDAGKSVKRRRTVIRLLKGISLAGGIVLLVTGMIVAGRRGALPSIGSATRQINHGYGTPTNQAALQAYMLGRARSEQWTPEGLAEGRKLYEESLKLEPGCALTYSALAANWRAEPGIGPTLGREAYPRVREFGLQALRLAPDLDVGHEKLGTVAGALDYDWNTAERCFRRAIECNRDNIQIRENFVYGLLLPLARTQEARAEVRTVYTSAVLNGASSEGSRGLTLDARVSYYTRDFERALQLQEQLVELNPSSRDQRLWRARVLEALGRFPEAIAGYESLQADSPRLDLECQAGLAFSLARGGQTNAARVRLAELLPHADEARAAVSLAWVYTALGEHGEALRWLETGYDRRDPWMIWLKVDPRFDALRNEQGFHALQKRMRLE